MPPKKKSPARKKTSVEKTEKTIVEQVMNERNFVVAPMEVPSTASVVHQSEFGQVRIEGEVTPQKLALAKQFDAIFQEATSEIMDLASFTPDERIVALVKSNKITSEMIQDMKKAPPWTFFDVGGEKLMKTPDNKLDSVKNYCFRLERAVLEQVKVRQSEVGKLQKDNNGLQDRIRILEQVNETLLENNKRSRAREEVLRKKNPTIMDRLALEFGPVYAKLKSAILKLLS